MQYSLFSVLAATLALTGVALASPTPTIAGAPPSVTSPPTSSALNFGLLQGSGTACNLVVMFGESCYTTFGSIGSVTSTTLTSQPTPSIASSCVWDSTITEVDGCGAIASVVQGSDGTHLVWGNEDCLMSPHLGGMCMNDV